MTSEEFNAILEARLQKIKMVLASKSKEYAKVERLHNFKMAGAAMRCTPAQALLGMMVKHWVSIVDLVEADAAGRHSEVERLLDEKNGDLINYAILLEAVLLESLNASKRRDP